MLPPGQQIGGGGDEAVDFADVAGGEQANKTAVFHQPKRVIKQIIWVDIDNCRVFKLGNMWVALAVNVNVAVEHIARLKGV